MLFTVVVLNPPEMIKGFSYFFSKVTDTLHKKLVILVSIQKLTSFFAESRPKWYMNFESIFKGLQPENFGFYMMEVLTNHPIRPRSNLDTI